jgi:hypothetical protein
MLIISENKGYNRDVEYTYYLLPLQALEEPCIWVRNGVDRVLQRVVA